MYSYEMLDELHHKFPNEGYDEVRKSINEKSFISPDGGFVFVIGKDGNKYPILIGEKKNQGTNNIRIEHGLGKQAYGNAIERLGKNVLAICGYTIPMFGMFPFICFGDGCDFHSGSTLLDRVSMCGAWVKLNTYNIFPRKNSYGAGTFFFREKEWEFDEMYERCKHIADECITYLINSNLV